jgi:hypothetical protein
MRTSSVLRGRRSRGRGFLRAKRWNARHHFVRLLSPVKACLVTKDYMPIIQPATESSLSSHKYIKAKMLLLRSRREGATCISEIAAYLTQLLAFHLRAQLHIDLASVNSNCPSTPLSQCSSALSVPRAPSAFLRDSSPPRRPRTRSPPMTPSSATLRPTSQRPTSPLLLQKDHSTRCFRKMWRPQRR